MEKNWREICYREGKNFKNVFKKRKITKGTKKGMARYEQRNIRRNMENTHSQTKEPDNRQLRLRVGRRNYG